MRGEVHRPRGKALETAQMVLEVGNPMACNVALGCSNGCGYCFGGRAYFKADWNDVRLPKYRPLELLIKQNIKPEGVFLCFATDPLLSVNRKNTTDLLAYLRENNVPTATLSKIDVPDVKGNRNGMTIVSLDGKFNRRWEPNAPSSLERFQKLKAKHDQGECTWVAIEPFPPPGIWKQDLFELLNALSFVDFMIFGKWNYDRRAGTKDARRFYAEKAIQGVLRDAQNKMLGQRAI